MNEEIKLLSLEYLNSEPKRVAEKAKSICYLTFNDKKGNVKLVAATGFYDKTIEKTGIPFGLLRAVMLSPVSTPHSLQNFLKYRI